MEPKSENIPAPPPSIVGGVTDPEDDGLGIRTKVRVLNKVLPARLLLLRGAFERIEDFSLHTCKRS